MRLSPKLTNGICGFNMYDLDDIKRSLEFTCDLVCPDMVYIYASYIQWAQNELIFAI